MRKRNKRNVLRVTARDRKSGRVIALIGSSMCGSERGGREREGGDS